MLRLNPQYRYLGHEDFQYRKLEPAERVIIKCLMCPNTYTPPFGMLEENLGICLHCIRRNVAYVSARDASHADRAALTALTAVTNALIKETHNGNITR